MINNKRKALKESKCKINKIKNFSKKKKKSFIYQSLTFFPFFFLNYLIILLNSIIFLKNIYKYINQDKYCNNYEISFQLLKLLILLM